MWESVLASTLCLWLYSSGQEPRKEIPLVACSGKQPESQWIQFTVTVRTVIHRQNKLIVLLLIQQIILNILSQSKGSSKSVLFVFLPGVKVLVIHCLHETKQWCDKCCFLAWSTILQVRVISTNLRSSGDSLPI